MAVFFQKIDDIDDKVRRVFMMYLGQKPYDGVKICDCPFLLMEKEG
jgi:hypothetical protein